MKVYITAPYSMKDLMKERAAELRAGGITVTSSWLDEPHKPTTQMHELTHEEHQGYAIQDVKDVINADILVFHTDPTQTIVRQGRSVELGLFIGYAIGTKKKRSVFVVGLEDENIFHHLPQVSHFASWETVRDLLIDLATPTRA